MDSIPKSGTRLSSERRKVERRRDAVKYKLLLRLLALRRAFGAETSIRVALKIGFTAEDAARFVEIGRERRLVRRRADIPGLKSSRRLRPGRSTGILASTLNNAEVDALRALAQKRPGGPRLRPGDYPAKLLNFGYIFRNCDGEPVLTHKGHQALQRQSCIEGALLVRETGGCKTLEASVRQWLEANGFIIATSAADCTMTAKGSIWLDTALNVGNSDRPDGPTPQ